MAGAGGADEPVVEAASVLKEAMRNDAGAGTDQAHRPLTAREFDVLKRLERFRDKEIAWDLSLSYDGADRTDRGPHPARHQGCRAFHFTDRIRSAAGGAGSGVGELAHHAGGCCAGGTVRAPSTAADGPEARLNGTDKIGQDRPRGTLQGTWQRVRYGDDDEHGPSQETLTLTFTRTRFIESVVTGDSATTDIRDTWFHQGGWSVGAAGTDTITKKFIDDGAEDSVDKQYVLAGDLLAVQCWTCEDPNAHYDVFTRVQDPGLALVGSWQFEWVWGRDNEDESDDVLFSLTDEVAESITLVREGRNRSGELGDTRTIEASWQRRSGCFAGEAATATRRR